MPKTIHVTGTISMKPSHLTSQEIPCLLWDPKIHYRSSRGHLSCDAV